MTATTTSEATNRAAVLYAVGDVRVEDRPVPVPGPREVLVEVRSVGVCGSDVHYYEHGRIADFVVREPMILGHEAAGVIVALGERADKHQIGQRVAMEPGVPCGSCHQCRVGRYNLCPYVRFFATPPIDGAFATFVVIDEDFAHPVPDSLSDDAAALIEPFSVGLWACRKAGVQPGESVLVTGAGPIGLLAMQAARCAGAGELTITDVNPSRLELARKLGASRTLDVRSEPLADAGVQADVLLECSGNLTAVTEGFGSLLPAGRAVLVGMGGDDVPLPLGLIQARELIVTGTFRYANIYPAAIALAATGQVDLDSLVTGRYGLDDAEEALKASRSDPAAVKTVVAPSPAA
jgi:L-iditol 2-dehydrogenase